MKCTIRAFGNDVPIVLTTNKYHNGRVAVIAHVGDEESDRWGVLTINVETASPPAEGEIHVKAWSENEEWVPQLLKLLPNHFQDTGRCTPTGYVNAQIWRFSEDGSLERPSETPS